MIKIIFFILFLLVKTSVAETIFSDDFEWGSDWAAANGTATPIANGWTGALTQNRGGSYDVMYVNSAGAKNGSRGLIQYWDQTSEYGSAQDAWLIRANTAFPNEFYIGYWLRFDPSWSWGSVASLKLLKIHFNDDTTWDIAWTNFCAGCTSWDVPTGCTFSYCTDDYGANWYGCWVDADGGDWHYFVWHINHSAGTLSLKMDGVDVAKTAYSTEYPGTGFDADYGINFGGNITDGGGGVAEMWTAYDDVIIATTEAEVLTFLQVSSETNRTAAGVIFSGCSPH